MPSSIYYEKKDRYQILCFGKTKEYICSFILERDFCQQVGIDVLNSKNRMGRYSSKNDPLRLLDRP